MCVCLECCLRTPAFPSIVLLGQRRAEGGCKQRSFGNFRISRDLSRDWLQHLFCGIFTNQTFTTSLLGEEAIRLWPRIVSEQKSYREKVVWWKYTMRHGECIGAIKKSAIWNTSGSIFVPKKTQKTLPVEHFYEIYHRRFFRL